MSAAAPVPECDELASPSDASSGMCTFSFGRLAPPPPSPMELVLLGPAIEGGPALDDAEKLRFWAGIGGDFMAELLVVAGVGFSAAADVATDDADTERCGSARLVSAF